jgi:NitT/TauT family transport system ATP-binding protein
VVFVTHDLHEATMLADRILFLSISPARVINQSRIDIPREKRGEETAIESRYSELKQLFSQLFP